MDRRTCPKCGATWYSADPRDWICGNCGAVIPRGQQAER